MKPFFIFFTVAFMVCIQGCKADGQETVSAKVFKEKISLPGVNIIDIRTEAEFNTGFIHGAQNIDYYNENFLETISKLDKEKPLAIYCKSGGRTKDALKMLDKSGFKNIYALKGGLLAWEHDGYELETVKLEEPSKSGISKAEYEKLIRSGKLVIVEFGATWCGPCKMLKPVLDKLSKQYASKGVKIISLDVDECKELANSLSVNEIPLVLFYKEGQLKEQMIGFNPEAVIVEIIGKYL